MYAVAPLLIASSRYSFLKLVPLQINSVLSFTSFELYVMYEKLISLLSYSISWSSSFNLFIICL